MKDMLCLAVIFALLPFKAEAQKIDLSNVGIVCQSHAQARALAYRDEMNGGTMFESLREYFFGNGFCAMDRTKALLIARFEVVHGSRGTYQVVEVSDSKGRRFWGFDTWYPQPSNSA